MMALNASSMPPKFNAGVPKRKSGIIAISNAHSSLVFCREARAFPIDGPLYTPRQYTDLVLGTTKNLPNFSSKFTISPKKPI